MKKIPVGLEEKINITIDRISHQGEGIGKIENFAVFVSGVIKGEKVKVKITEIRKNFARGELEEVLLPSQNREKPPCSVFNFCGGCHLQHIKYKKQLEMKKEIVENALFWLDNQNINIMPVLGMVCPWHYRNKGHFHISKENNKIKLGFYKSKSHKLIPVSRCLLFSENINNLIRYLEEELTRQDVSIYDQKTDRGDFRGIILRESKHSGETMIIFITREESLNLNQNFLDKIATIFPQVVSIYQNVNKNPKMSILGKKFKNLKGKSFIEDYIGSYVFKISPSSFFQINVPQTEALYEKISQCINLTGEEIVIDSYCGTGTISIYLAGKAKKVYGLELHKGAVNDAWVNGKLNQFLNLKFFPGKAEDWLYKWTQGSEKADVVIIDPPRKGCSRQFLKNIFKANPKQIVYVSCDMLTMTRDIRYIVQNDYLIKTVQPVDMFPHTSHIECLVHLTK